MDVWIYVSLYLCIDVRMYVYTYICVYVYVHIYIYVCAYIYMYTHTYACVFVRIKYVDICMCDYTMCMSYRAVQKCRGRRELQLYSLTHQRRHCATLPGSHSRRHKVSRNSYSRSHKVGM